MWGAWFGGGDRREELRPYYYDNGKYSSGRHGHGGGGSARGQYGGAMGDYEFYESGEPAYEPDPYRTPRVCLTDAGMHSSLAIPRQ